MSPLIKRALELDVHAHRTVEKHMVTFEGQPYEVPVSITPQLYRRRRQHGFSHEESCDLNRKRRRAPKPAQPGSQYRAWNGPTDPAEMSEDQRRVVAKRGMK